MNNRFCWFIVFAIWLVGCATSPSVEPPDDAAKWSESKLLFEASVSVLKHRKMPIETRSHRFGIIESESIPVSPQKRKTVLVRFLQVPGKAIPVRVRITYEKYLEETSEWTSLSRNKISGIEHEELRILRQIEERFQEWKQMAKSEKRSQEK